MSLPLIEVTVNGFSHKRSPLPLSRQRRRLPHCYATLLFAVFMTALMALLMSGLLTAFNQGLTPDFLSRWLQAYALSWVVAFPTALFVIPLVRRLVQSITAE